MVRQANGTFKFVGNNATVILNSDGQVVIHSCDRHTRRVEEPVGLEWVPSRVERAHHGHHQPAQVGWVITLIEHQRAT